MSDNKTESPILALQHQRLLLDMEYNADKEAFRSVQEHGMAADFGWEASAKQYRALYREVLR